MPALVASTMNCLLLKTGLFFRLSQKPHQQVPEHLTAWQIFGEITAAKIWQNCKCQGRAEIHLSKYSRFLLQIDSFTAENQIMTSFAYYVMVCIGKGNTLVLKPFFEKSNQNIVAFLQHLFRQNFVTREHNCRKLCPFIYLTAQPWALAPLSINKETTIMSITETWVSCYKAVIRNWSQQIKIITEKQREERNISFQRSKSHKVMFNKERVFLTEQMYWHLRSARSYTAMQYFQEEKKKNKKPPKQLWKSLMRQHRRNSKFNILFCPEVGAEQRRISSFFERPALARRADLSPLLKSVGTGIFETGHDLLKGQGQLKTHISGRAYYCQ